MKIQLISEALYLRTEFENGMFSFWKNNLQDENFIIKEFEKGSPQIFNVSVHLKLFFLFTGKLSYRDAPKNILNYLRIGTLKLNQIFQNQLNTETPFDSSCHVSCKLHQMR